MPAITDRGYGRSAARIVACAKRSSARSIEPVEELRGRISLVVMVAFGLDNWGQGLLSFLWKGDEWTAICLQSFVL